MAGNLVERIKIIFDVDDAPGVKGFKSIRTEMANAEGAAGKLKAGFKGMGDMLAQNAGPIALAAGAALVTFGIKAVAAFERTAKAAIDMGAAVGLSTEDASRWIAIGDDMGVTADQLTTAFGRVGKTLDSGAWEKYGIATRDAAGNVRNTNDIVLDAFDSLGKITNQTERAKAGNELFSKGYASLAPMIGKTRAEMEQYLAEVEGGQVITDDEAKKAEKMRLAQDKLSDALNEGTMAAGEFVANLAPLISGLADVVTWLTGAQEKTEEWARDLAGIGDDPAMGLGKFSGAVKVANDGTADFSRVIDDFNRGTGAAFKQAASDAADATRKWKDDVAALLGALDAEDAFANFQTSMWNYRSQVDPSAQSTRDYIRELAKMVDGLAGVPAETKSRMIAYLEDGDIETVEGFLTTWGKGVTVPVRFVGQGKVGFMKDEFATGTDFAPGGRVLVGERGPEIVDLPHGSTVYPAHESRAMQMAGQPGIGASSDQTAGITSTFHLNVNAPIYGVTDLERTVQRAIDQHDRLLVQSLRAGQRR